MLTTKDVAALLNVGTDAVHKLIARGRLRAVRKGKGRPTLYVVSSVVDELERRRQHLP